MSQALEIEEAAEARSQTLGAAAFFLAEALLTELSNCADLERRRELATGLESAMARLGEADADLPRYLSMLVARGVRPATEEFDEHGCRFKHLRHNTALVQQTRMKGHGLCAHCSRILVRLG